MKRRRSRTHTEEADASYGMTAITLGEDLKKQLDQLAGESGNRSRVVREALELYFPQVPKFQERYQEIRDNAFMVALYRIVSAFRRVLDRFDYDCMDGTPYGDACDAIDRLEKWLFERLPKYRLMGLKLEAPRLEEAISDLEAGRSRFWLASSGKEWEELRERWEHARQRKKGG